MTPKEKAIELLGKFSNVPLLDSYEAKQCALISVDEIINNGNLEPQLKRHIGNVEPYIIHLEYWFKVKHEINNI
jgi:hypothetical protein